MIAFFKDYFRFKPQVKKQLAWIAKYAENKGYALNPSWMMRTNLALWLNEMELTFGKRYCPCFEPSADEALNKSMLCPCKYIDEEIKRYGSCHCALFGSPKLDKKAWKSSSKRLMGEYRVALNLKSGVLDTRGMPLDPLRNLPVPDAMHQLKMALNSDGGKTLTMIVATEQEVKNLEKIAAFKSLGYACTPTKEGYLEVAITR